MREHVIPPLALSRGGEQPLSAQLRDQLRAAVTAGLLRPGERLPSTRTLARHLGVSRIVVTEAYQQLTAEGRLDGRHGSGTFVSDGPPPPPRAPSGAGGGAGLTTRPGEHRPPRGPVDLRSGKPWVRDYDAAAWRRAWRSAGTLPPADDSDPFGLAELRTLLADHLRRARAVPVRADNILITRGTGHGLDILTATVIRPGQRVGVEEPGYRVARNILAARGARVVPVRVDDQGVIVEELPGDLSLLYTTPAHQFPLGGRLPNERRVRLLEWARRSDTFVVEDDYDAEFRYDVAPLPTLYSQAPDQVVLIGTLSKSLSPDVGLGWIIASRELLGRIARRRDDLSDRTPGATQQAVATLIASGDLDRHLHRMRREYARRRAAIIDRLGPYVTGEAAGLHVMIKLAPDITADVVARAAAHGVLLETTERHCSGTPLIHGLVLGYGSASLAEVKRACAVLAHLLDEAVRAAAAQVP